MERVLTFDVDWASDPVLDYVFDILSDHGVKSTWFFSHSSPSTRRIALSPLVEVGIHPNFRSESTQGKTFTSIMDNLMGWFPQAKCARTHGMIYSAEIAQLFWQYGMKIDSSIYAPGAPAYQKKYKDGSIWRIPYNWADDVVLSGDYDFFDQESEDGMWRQVMCFHPIHVYFNSFNMERYNQWKNGRDGMAGDPLDEGMHKWLLKILMEQSSFKFLSEIVWDEALEAFYDSKNDKMTCGDFAKKYPR